MQTLHLFNGEDAKKTQFPQFEQPRSYGFSESRLSHSFTVDYSFTASLQNTLMLQFMIRKIKTISDMSRRTWQVDVVTEKLPRADADSIIRALLFSWKLQTV